MQKLEVSREQNSRWTFFEITRDEKYPTLLFLITRDHDETVYLYNAKRVENVLIEPFIDISSVQVKEIEKQSPVSDMLIEQFLGMKIAQEGKVYDAILYALPEKRLQFKLKAVNSRVTASYTACVSYMNFGKLEALQIDNAEIYNVHTPVTFNAIGLPDLSSITVYSRVAFQEIAKALKKKKIESIEFQGKPTTIFYLTETIIATAEMKAKYNIKSLFAMFTEAPKQI